MANGPVNSHSELPSSHHSSARFDKDNGLPRGEIKQQVTVKADSAGANTAFVALDKDKDFSAKVANGPVNSHSELPSSHHSSARFDKDNGLTRGEIKQQVTVKADSAGANTAFVALDKDKDFSAKVANGPVNSHSELPSSHHSSARFDKDNGLTRGEIKQQVTLNAGLVSHSANGHLGKEELNVKVTKGAVKFHSESSIGNSASFHLGQYGDLHKELVKEQPKSNINSAIGGEPLNYLSHQICTSNVNAFEKTENGFNYLSQSTDVSITTNREPELQAVTQASLGINHISDISNRTSTCYLLGNYIHVNTYRVYFRDKCYTFEFRYSGRNELIRFVERKYDGY